MTLTRWLREKVEEEQMEKARTQGAARERAAWLIWYEKLRESQKKGEPFDEPPPEL